MFPKNLRDRVDQDYSHKLSDEDARWLSDFNEAYYGGDFRRDEDGEWTDADRRSVWRMNGAAKRDSISVAQVGHAVDYFGDPRTHDSPAPEQAWATSPAYLESDLYREALAVVRQLQDAGLTHTPEYVSARAWLKAVTDYGEDSDE